MNQSFLRRARLSSVPLSIFCAILLQGCGSIHVYTYRNEPAAKDEAGKPVFSFTKASELALGPTEVFVGVALSGGGSRAANFGSAVLLQLEQLGFLKFVSAISSVSGGSLPGAYYGLFREDSKEWNEKKLRELMATDFEGKLLLRMLAPHNLVRYSLTDYDRTDIMAGILDDILFHGRTFADLRSPVFLNSTANNSSGQQFVFSDETFHFLNSRLDKYPIASAVSASAAFPGVFNSVTLRNFMMNPDVPVPTAPSNPLLFLPPVVAPFVHLFDGGVDDNLGVLTLANLYRRLALARHTAGLSTSCFLIVINSEVAGGRSAKFGGGYLPDLRSGFGYLVDTNAMSASDILFKNANWNLRTFLGLDKPEERAFYETQQAFDESLKTSASGKCTVWHISLARYETLFDRNVFHGPEGAVVSQITTRFKLVGPPQFKASELQNFLFNAAETVVLRDPDGLMLRACSWFRDHRLMGLECEKYLSTALSRPAMPPPLTNQPTEDYDSEIFAAGGPDIHVKDAGWRRVVGLNASRVLIHPPSGSSFKFSTETISDKIMEGFLDTGEKIEWLRDVGLAKDGIEAAVVFLKRFLDDTLKFKIRSPRTDLSMQHASLTNSSTNAIVFPIALAPLDQLLDVKVVRLGNHDFAYAEFDTAYETEAGSPELLKTSIYITNLARQSESNWEYVVGWYNIPKKAEPNSAEHLKQVFIDSLANFDEDTGNH